MKESKTRRKPKSGGHVKDVRFIEVELGEDISAKQMVIDLGAGIELRVERSGIGLAAALIEHLRELRGQGGAV